MDNALEAVSHKRSECILCFTAEQPDHFTVEADQLLHSEGTVQEKTAWKKLPEARDHGQGLLIYFQIFQNIFIHKCPPAFQLNGIIS